jgi:TonB family protein
MFGNLIESSSHKGDYTRRGWFFLGTLMAYALVFMAIGVGSIYAYNTHIENQNLELVSLITPIETTQVQTPQRSETPRPSVAGNNDSKVAVVRTPPVMTTMEPRHVPDKASVGSDVTELPVGTIYKIGIPGPSDNVLGSPGNRMPGDGSGGNNPGSSKELEELVKETPPPSTKKETVKLPMKTVSRGVVNGQASNLPKPVYSAIARAARASGTVTVQVLIDEFGKVVSARALSGHPLLLKESVQAAYQARFTPTTLSNQPVKVSGIITYNFVM